MTQNIKTTKTLLDFIQEYAVIGSWDYDVKATKLNWSPETAKIHEVPTDFVPDVETGINFYKEGYSRNIITKLFGDSLVKHQDFDVELQIVTGTGNDKWVRAIGMPIIENGVCVKVQGLFQDINEKTKTAKALAIKEEQLRRTFDYALIGMATLDIDGKWLSVNKSICKMLGYTELELTKLSFLDITHPDDKSSGKSQIVEMVIGKRESFQSEKRYIKKNGTIVWALLSVSIVKDEDGKPLHFVAQINDITESRKKTRKINQLLDTTNKQNERLLNFAHIVSHNLRSHYSNLDMLLDITAIDYPEYTNIKIFPMLQDAVKQLSETVEHLNEVAAITTKKGIPAERLNLLSYINKAKASLNAIIANSNTKIDIAISPSVNVYGIPAYLDSILLNFLTNAIKYKKPEQPAQIEIKASKKDGIVELKIKDHGLGIDLKKYGKKLFGMYKTFHKHKDARGLGLFITRNQIEAIGGTIAVESTINSGTTFTINLKAYE
ncbi:PAS domain S-box protein [uncultured Winogradskyella sp.]|uniref:sensor histidine kinase n=1 Tax=uncultured Winogradskyella sp. TaxID=395353 RepID=UPI0030D92BB8|tara:strand:- start:42189 stop:43667 length:1479 start_codon:yes stop_codon:yes gene_type:complete